MPPKKKMKKKKVYKKMYKMSDREIEYNYGIRIVVWGRRILTKEEHIIMEKIIMEEEYPNLKMQEDKTKYFVTSIISEDYTIENIREKIRERKRREEHIDEGYEEEYSDEEDED